ncbi:MAG: LamG-like jellyroll fold domain-containing protein [Pyrinomonadaceae bacterium]
MFCKTDKVMLPILIAMSGLFFNVAGQTCAPTPSGLVAWYKAEGNADDSSGNGHDGTGGVFTTGHVGQAFDSTAAIVDVPDDPTLNQQTLTIEGWVTANNYDCVGCATHFASKSGSNGTFGWEFGTNRDSITGFAGGLRFTLNGAAGGADLLDGTDITDGLFHHVAATYDGSDMRIYLDGILIAQKSLATAVSYQPNSPLRIGRRQETTNGQPHQGLIDELTYYDRALSQAEIAAIHTAGTAGKCTTPLAAGVTVGGRVVTANGRGVSKVRIQVTDAAGNMRTALTNPFGYYRFDDVPAGGTYIIQLNSKRHLFGNNPAVLFVGDELTNVDFTALP